MPDDFETIAFCANLCLIRNSFFVPKVEQAF
jgi:hypothetical protein